MACSEGPSEGRKIPIVLVRSHADSLGLEYGRLGSAVFVAYKKRYGAHGRLVDFAREMRDAVRFFGGAALPAHFPLMSERKPTGC